MDSETKSALASEFSDTNKADAEVGGSGVVYSVNAKVTTDLSRASKKSKEEMEKLLKESKERIEWDGQKFVPKPMELSRLNMVKLADKQAFRDVTARVSYTTSMLTIAVQVISSLDTNFVQPSDLMQLKSQLLSMKELYL